MSAIEILETFGPIFGMDQMCTGTGPQDIAVGRKLVRSCPSDEEPIVVTVAALQGTQDADGNLNRRIGIGLRGPKAHMIEPGDLLQYQD